MAAVQVLAERQKKAKGAFEALGKSLRADGEESRAVAQVRRSLSTYNAVERVTRPLNLGAFALISEEMRVAGFPDLPTDIPSILAQPNTSQPLYIPESRNQSNNNLPNTYTSHKYEETEEDKETIYWVEFSDRGRRIMLNGKKQLAKLNFCSENDLVFSYMFQRPGTRITLKELEEHAVDGTIKKPLYAIVRDLGFTGALGRMFFDVSKTAIRFNNNITRQDLKELGLADISILLH